MVHDYDNFQGCYEGGCGFSLETHLSLYHYKSSVRSNKMHRRCWKKGSYHS